MNLDIIVSVDTVERSRIIKINNASNMKCLSITSKFVTELYVMGSWSLVTDRDDIRTTLLHLGSRLKGKYIAGLHKGILTPGFFV